MQRRSNERPTPHRLPSGQPTSVPGEPGLDELISLTMDEAVVLEAMLERLLPADSHGPGAGEARVLRYIDRALAGDLRNLRALYAENLPALDTAAGATHGDRFADLAPELQDGLLGDLEGGPFFETVRQHAIEGMFSDPLHGGNAGGAGWRLIGFPGPKGIFSAEDQRIDEG